MKKILTISLAFLIWGNVYSQQEKEILEKINFDGIYCTDFLELVENLNGIKNMKFFPIGDDERKWVNEERIRLKLWDNSLNNNKTKIFKEIVLNNNEKYLFKENGEIKYSYSYDSINKNFVEDSKRVSFSENYVKIIAVGPFKDVIQTFYFNSKNEITKFINGSSSYSFKYQNNKIIEALIENDVTTNKFYFKYENEKLIKVVFPNSVEETNSIKSISYYYEPFLTRKVYDYENDGMNGAILKAEYFFDSELYVTKSEISSISLSSESITKSLENYFYNENHQIIKIKRTSSCDNCSVDTKKLLKSSYSVDDYSYDKFGNRTSFRVISFGYDIKTIKYDKPFFPNKDIDGTIKEYRESRKIISFDVEADTVEYTSEYKFDKYNNWVEKEDFTVNTMTQIRRDWEYEYVKRKGVTLYSPSELDKVFNEFLRSANIPKNKSSGFTKREITYY